MDHKGYDGYYHSGAIDECAKCTNHYVGKQAMCRNATPSDQQKSHSRNPCDEQLPKNPALGSRWTFPSKHWGREVHSVVGFGISWDDHPLVFIYPVGKNSGGPYRSVGIKTFWKEAVAPGPIKITPRQIVNFDPCLDGLATLCYALGAMSLPAARQIRDLANSPVVSRWDTFYISIYRALLTMSSGVMDTELEIADLYKKCEPLTNPAHPRWLLLKMGRITEAQSKELLDSDIINLCKRGYV